MKGWFDAFRNDGGPTLYMFSNRTPVTGDVGIISIILVFSTLLIAFLVIFPGVRKERFTTFLSVTLSLFVGSIILIANHGSSWHVGRTEIESTYRAFSNERLQAELGAFIGLSHVNVTLKAIPVDNKTEDIDFNERFWWIGSHQMGNSYKLSLKRGLPFPILTVAEYLSHCQEGFNWGAHYRAAGYYASVCLWASFASWLMMNLLLIVVPRYGAYAMITTGFLMLLSDLIYWHMLPPNELVVRIEKSILKFNFGNCFYMVLYSGVLCMIVGIVIAALDRVFPHKFSTILEVDYDTPYDRHIIIEDSHVTRNKKKMTNRVEEAPAVGLGTRILRRLSSKRSQIDGIDNEGFELDPPKSPWRYPFRESAFPTLNEHSSRSRCDRGNTNETSTTTHPVRSHIQLSRPPPRVPKYPFNRQISADSQDSSMTDRSGSSLGLSFLNRIRESQRVGTSPLAQQPTIHLHEKVVGHKRNKDNSKRDMW